MKKKNLFHQIVTILNYFGGHSKQNNGFSTVRDFGAATQKSRTVEKPLFCSLRPPK